MKLVLVLLAVFAVSSASAADKPMTAQQQKMVTCNKEATDKNLKGPERTDFMKQCLSAGSSKKNAQQQKMASCNKDAGSLKGAERQKFMSDCLKK
jgi:hypothetical protein